MHFSPHQFHYFKDIRLYLKLSQSIWRDSDEIRREQRSTVRGGREGKLPQVGGLEWAGMGFPHVFTTALLLSPTVAHSRVPPHAYSFLLPRNQSSIFITAHNKDYTCLPPFQRGVATMDHEDGPVLQGGRTWRVRSLMPDGWGPPGGDQRVPNVFTASTDAL